MSNSTIEELRNRLIAAEARAERAEEALREYTKEERWCHFVPLKDAPHWQWVGEEHPAYIASAALLAPQERGAEGEEGDPMCECDHRLSAHTPCCVSACGCDEFQPKPLTDADVDAFLAQPDDPRFSSPEAKARMWKKLQQRLASPGEAGKGEGEENATV